jgi:protein TonB
MFDRYVADTRPNWKRRAWVMGSIIAHVVGGMALIIYSIFHVEEIAPPAVSLTFFSAPPPPPPPPPPAGKKREQPKQQPKPDVVVKEKPFVQPVDKPPDKKPEPQPEPDDGDDGDDGEKDGQKGGEKGGEKGGQLGGKIGGMSTEKPVPPKKEQMRAEFTLKKVNHPDPHLPDWFKNQHPGQRVEGRYKVCLNPDGHVAYVSTLVGLSGLDMEIMNHIKGNWVYQLPPSAPDTVICFQAFIKFDIK